MVRKKDPFYIRITHWAACHGFLHCVPMLMYFLVYLLWFHLVEVIPRKHYMTIELPIDRSIPFLEIFVIPYLSWFALVAFGMFYIYRKDAAEFDRVSTVLVIGMSLFLLISTVLPNRQDLRLAVMPRDNVFTRMVAFVWHSDTPTNVWPSIHVFNALAVSTGLIHTEKHGKNRVGMKIAYAVWAILIIMSTVFIKQHSLFDVFTGAGLAAACFVWVYGRGNVFRLPKLTQFLVVNEKTGRNMDLVVPASSAPMTEAEFAVFRAERIDKRKAKKKDREPGDGRLSDGNAGKRRGMERSVRQVRKVWNRETKSPGGEKEKSVG